MKSIRKRLVLWLLLGLSALWAAASAGIYYTVRHSELTKLDAQLNKVESVARMVVATSARDIAKTLRPGRADRPGGTGRGGANNARLRRPEDRWPEFFSTSGTSFFQIWDGHGNVRHKSESLGEREFAPPEMRSPARPKFYSTTLGDGTEVRAKAMELRPQPPGRHRRPGNSPRRPNGAGVRVTAVVAIDSGGMRQTLASLLLGIAGVGVAAAAASVTLVHFAIKDGLRPLRQLGDRLAEIDAQSLDGRFSNNNLPIEISPIADRLNELMGRLERSFERERRFSADLAHELRTPVAELRTMAEVALRWPDEKGSDDAQAALDIAKQMGGIIESLLGLARHENGQAEIEPETVSLAEFTADCWAPFAERAAGRGLDIRLDLPEGGTIETDPEMLRLILNNLFSNACDYTPEGGRIEIVAASGEHDGALLQVANNAPELDEESVQHLFERFWRRDGARADNTHSGLGLSLARACARSIDLDLDAHMEGKEKLVFRLCEKQETILPNVIST